MADVRVPELVVAKPLTEAIAWRVERLGGGGSRIALVTDGGTRLTVGALQAADLEVAGLLGPDALESIAWAAEVGVDRAYADLPALLSDDVESIAIDLPPPRSDTLVQAAAKAGLHVLLTTPRVGDTAGVMRAVLAMEDADLRHAVAFLGRCDAAYSSIAAALPTLGVVHQITAVGWPAGGPPRAELVDVVRRWCGDIVAVCADPAEMPAGSLGPDEPVTLALLTETGATVLASERFAARQADVLLTVVGDRGRAVLSGERLALPDGTRRVARSTAAAAIGLAARSLVDPDLHPSAATLADLVAAANVLSAVEQSRVDGGWVELP